jgi:hypothetical protein
MEYHEIYGWLPKSAIDCIPEYERRKAFAAWVTQSPNPAGRYIVNVVVKSLGDDFLKYVLDGLISCIVVDDGESLTTDLVKYELTQVLDSWATDTNLLMMAVDDYRENVLHLDEIPFDEEEDTPAAKPKSKPKRDSKGRFIKSE